MRFTFGVVQFGPAAQLQARFHAYCSKIGSNIYSKIDRMIKGGAPEDIERMIARMAADERRPFDDPAAIREFPKYGRPLVKVAGIYGKAVGWTSMYGLIEWLDSSGKYHLGWAHSSSIKRVSPDEWKGASGL